MRFLALLIFLVSALLFLSQNSSASTTPKTLEKQVQNLVTLLSDGYAVGYPKATLIQNTTMVPTKEITLVVFSIEGFGGGNNWTQYLAAFSQEPTEKGEPYFMLMDVIRIGGGGWRSIYKLNAKITYSSLQNEATIIIDTVENTEKDPPNFPSKKATVKLLLKKGRFSEQYQTKQNY